MTQQQRDDVHADPGLAPSYRLSKAQAPPATTTAQRPEERSQEFVPVGAGEGQQNTASASTLLVTAYLVMWALLLGFLFMSWRRSQRIEARLTGLEQALTKHESTDKD